MATAAQYNTVLRYVQLAKDDGATVVLGGEPDGHLGGFFIRPTVLTGLKPDATVVREEVFGPVLSTLPFRDEAEAIELANATDYGLAAGIWTKDIHRAHRVVSQLHAGTVWVNSYRAAGPSVPFGGFNDSGIGRENGVEGLNEYLQTKSVWVELSGQSRDSFVMGLANPASVGRRES
jgi:aldehyde dehydrogenase (NAD+)